MVVVVVIVMTLFHLIQAYFLTQMKLGANARALRVRDPRNPLALAHAVRALAATLSLMVEVRLF